MNNDSILERLTITYSPVEAEQALIGAILVNNEAYGATCRYIKQEYFSDKLHAKIWGIIESKISNGGYVSPVTLLPELAKTPDISADMGIGRYLSTLAMNAVAIISAPDYAKHLRDEYVRRMTVEHLKNEIEATVNGKTVNQLLEKVEELVHNGNEELKISDEKQHFTASNFADNFFEYLEVSGGLKTGLEEFDKIVGGFKAGDVHIIAGRPAMGKALHKDEPVLLSNGIFKAIKDLKVGDSLASCDGLPSIVNGFYPQGEKKTYSIKFRDDRTVKCCGEHLWEVFSSKWDKPRVIDTHEIIRLIELDSYKNRLYIRYISGDFGISKVMPFDPYIIGALIGDGNITECSNISIPDEFIKNKILSLLPDGFSLNKQKGDDISYNIVDNLSHKNRLTDYLREIGLYGKKSPQKFIPDFYFSCSREQRLSLMNGLLDTDGWVEKKGSLCFSSSSEQLSKDVAHLAHSLGYISSITRSNSQYKKGNVIVKCLDTFKVYIGGKPKKELVTLPKKYDRLVNYKKFKSLTIKSVIENKEFSDCYCISISHKSKLFVTRDYILTHNTALAVDLAVRFAQQGYKGAFFSMEMNRHAIGGRIGSRLSYKDGWGVYPSQLLNNDYRQRVDDARREFKKLPLFIDCEGGITLQGIKSKCDLAQKVLGGLDFIFVDHISLISHTTAYNNKNNETEQKSAFLKKLAMDLDIPIFVLSQVNRSNEKDDDKRPMMSNLRDSGAIEQDAATVIFPYRESYYLKSKTDGASISKYEQTKNEIEFIVAKNRHGDTGTSRHFVDLGCSYFDSLNYNRA